MPAARRARKASAGKPARQDRQGRHIPIPQVGIVEVGDDVRIGAHTTIDRARFEATRIGRGTKLDEAIAAKTYDYYIGELKPFSRKLAVPEQIVQSTVKTLIEIGDIKPDSAGKTYLDLSYLPK